MANSVSEKATNEPSDARWIAVITYRRRGGFVSAKAWPMEELEELQDIVERGPNWNAIESIAIRLNPMRAEYPGAVAEEAADL